MNVMNLEQICNSLNGAVQSEGLKVSVENWLDMGSVEWKNTPDKVKAYAYQAVKAKGWTDEGLISFMVGRFKPRIDESTARFAIEILTDLVKQYSVAVINPENGESK